MSSSDTHQNDMSPSPDTTASPLSFRNRLFRRIKYMVFGCCVAGGYLGIRVEGAIGAVVGIVAGAVIGLCVGLVIGGYAWFLESPFKGAIRVGGLVGALVGLSKLVMQLKEQGFNDFENTLIEVFLAGSLGVVIAAPFGAFVAWIAGPIFRELVQEADRGDSPLKRRRVW